MPGMEIVRGAILFALCSPALVTSYSHHYTPHGEESEVDSSSRWGADRAEYPPHLVESAAATDGTNPPAGTNITNPPAGTNITNPPAGSKEENLPTEEEVRSALNKCPRPESPARKKMNEVKRDQDKARGKPPSDQSSTSLVGSTGSGLPKKIVEATGKGFDLLSKIGSTMKDMKFKDKAESVRENLGMKTALGLRMAHLRPGNPNVLLKAKALARLAKAASSVLGALGSVTAFLGPIGAGVGIIFSIVAIFIPQPDPNEAVLNMMKEGFEKINERFDMIERLEELELTVEKTAVFAYYKSNQDRLRDVMFAYRQFTSTPTNITLRILQEICHLNNPQFTLAWIHRHVVLKQVGLELMPTILKAVEYDRNALVEWIQIILTDALHAAFLQEVCIGVRFGEKSVMTKMNNQSLNRAELFCSVSFARNETDRMTQEITQKLDGVEMELLETFDKIQLEKDVKKFLQKLRGGPCVIRDRMKQKLDTKYYWLNWFVLVSKHDHRPLISSVDGHYAQAQAEVLNEEKKAWVTVIGSEMEQEQNVPEAFFHKFDFDQRYSSRGVPTYPTYEGLESNDSGMINLTRHYTPASNSPFDNFVEVKFTLDTLLCPSDFEATKKVSFFLKTKHAWALMLTKNKTTDQQYFDMFIMYKTRYAPNTFGCLAPSGEIKKLKPPTRQQQCSGIAFKRLIRNQAAYAMKGKNWTDQDAPKNLRNYLIAAFSDFTFTLLPSSDTYPFAGKRVKTINTCTDDVLNCAEVEDASRENMTIVWSMKCDRSLYLANANKSFEFMIRHSANLFGINNPKSPLKAPMVYDFIMDPQAYMTKFNMTQRNIDADEVNFVGDKVIIIQAL